MLSAVKSHHCLYSHRLERNQSPKRVECGRISSVDQGTDSAVTELRQWSDTHGIHQYYTVPHYSTMLMLIVLNGGHIARWIIVLWDRNSGSCAELYLKWCCALFERYISSGYIYNFNITLDKIWRMYKMIVQEKEDIWEDSGVWTQRLTADTHLACDCLWYYHISLGFFFSLGKRGHFRDR